LASAAQKNEESQTGAVIKQVALDKPVRRCTNDRRENPDLEQLGVVGHLAVSSEHRDQPAHHGDNGSGQAERTSIGSQLEPGLVGKDGLVDQARLPRVVSEVARADPGRMSFDQGDGSLPEVLPDLHRLLGLLTRKHAGGSGGVLFLGGGLQRRP
jgi:hypothetical protein